MHEGLAGLLATASTGVRTFLAARRADLGAASKAILASLWALLGNTMQAAHTQVDQARTSLDGIALGVTATMDAQVGGVAGRITGAVDNLPLPNLPGVSALKSGAKALAARAAAAITAGLAQARGLISSALQGGAAVLGSVLTSAGKAATSVITQVTNGINRAVQAVFQRLQHVGVMVVGRLRSALNGTVLAGVHRAESKLAGNLATAQKKAVTAVRDNRDRHVQALRSGKGGPEVVGAACENNAGVVTTFRERTTSILGSVFGTLAGGLSALGARIDQVVSRVTDAVHGPVVKAVAQLRQAGDEAGDALRSLLSSVGTAITGVVDFVRSAVQHPVETLTKSASGAAARAGQFFSGLVSRVLSGMFSLPQVSDVIGDVRTSSRGPITKPRPGPITIPGLLKGFFSLALFVVVIVAIEIVAVVITALGVVVSPAVFVVLVGLVAVALLALALLLLYLLYQAVKPKPKPPCTITTKTLQSAPDGTADTRKAVGVNEQVQLTASVSANWSANVGTVTPATGSTVTWTAPGTNGTAIITATPTSGSPCSVTMTVVRPSGRSLTNPKLRVYTPRLAGSGFIADVTIMPTNVSFSRIEVREETATSTATGYYDTELSWDGITHPLGEWLPVDKHNSGIEDKVGSPTPGTPPPFSLGNFTWPIPQSYRVVGGGAGNGYSTGTHTQDMTGPTGEETTTKEGASLTRTPITTPAPSPTPGPPP